MSDEEIDGLFISDEPLPDEDPEGEEPDRLPDIRKAVKEGYVGNLLMQRDFWREATQYLLERFDEECEE